MKQLLRAVLAAMVIGIPVASFAAQAGEPQHWPYQTSDANSKEAPRGDSATNTQTAANAAGYGGSLIGSSESSSFARPGQNRALYAHH